MTVSVKCQRCGKEFETIARTQGRQKYCSRQCYWKAWEGNHPELYKLPNRICEECGKEFHPRDKDHGKRFCSRGCQRKNGTLKRTVKCIVCGAEFSRDNAREKFCSQKCFHDYNHGENNGHFKNWLTHEAVDGYQRFTAGHPEYSRKLLHSVLWHKANPNGECEMCGGEVEIVHHRDEDKTNYKLQNLAGLCIKCHMKIHHPKKS